MNISYIRVFIEEKIMKKSLDRTLPIWKKIMKSIRLKIYSISPDILKIWILLEKMCNVMKNNLKMIYLKSWKASN